MTKKKIKNMRKLGFLLLILTLTFTLVVCGEKLKIEETKIITPIDAKDIKLVQSFGNQQNQQWMLDREFIQDDGWIYSVDKYFTEMPKDMDSEKRTIVRFFLDNPEKQEVIYKGVCLEQISVLGDWVFFLEGEWEENLYKIKKDGSEKTKLASKVDVYILTEGEIYYETKGEEVKICAMDLDGSHKRDVLGSGHGLVGIDHGWIYFDKYNKSGSLKEPGPYRMKIDGTGKERVLGPNFGAWRAFTVDHDSLFFSRWNKNKVYIVNRLIDEGEEETVSGPFSTNDSFSGDGPPPGLPINKEGDWLFFCIGGKAYKINVKGGGKKELIYRNSLSISNILLYDGDVLLCVGQRGGKYIKKDGTIIDIGIELERVLRSIQN